MGQGTRLKKRPNPMVILTPQPHKPKELPKSVDTLSQVSTLDDVKMAEVSLEGVPTTISPIATTTTSRSITPPADAAEFWENANKALEELMATKSSIDTLRQRAIWELEEQVNLRGKAEAKLTSSLPVRLPYMPAQWSSKACW